jgi:phosphoglycolate phosphatase
MSITAASPVSPASVPSATASPTLIFDFDGTLADTLSAIIKIINEHSQEYHFQPLGDKDVENLRGMSNLDIIKKYHIPIVKIPAFMLHIQKELHQRIDQVELFPGVRDLVLSLKRRSFRLGILTSNSRENVQKLLRARDLDVFDFIHAESNIFGKTRALQHLLHKHGLGKDGVIYVGDETRDIEASQHAGVAVIAVTWGFHRKDVLRAKNPTFLVDSPVEIENIVTA